MQPHNDHSHRQRFNQLLDSYKDIYAAARDMLEAFQEEASKNRSGLRVYQKADAVHENLKKTGFTIFQKAGAVREKLVQTAEQVHAKAQNDISATKEMAATVTTAAKNVTQSAQKLIQNPAPPQTSPIAYLPEEVFETPNACDPQNYASNTDQKPQEKHESAPSQDTAQSLPPQQSQAPKPQIDPAAQKTPETQSQEQELSTPEQPETSDVKDRLLFDKGKVSPEMQLEDMHAIASLFTAQKGDVITGDMGKGLVVEYNGKTLLETDSRTGAVLTNNLQNPEIMNSFDARQKLEISDFISKCEALKEPLQQAIDQRDQNTAQSHTFSQAASQMMQQDQKKAETSSIPEQQTAEASPTPSSPPKPQIDPDPAERTENQAKEQKEPSTKTLSPDAEKFHAVYQHTQTDPDRVVSKNDPEIQKINQQLSSNPAREDILQRNVGVVATAIHVNAPGEMLKQGVIEGSVTAPNGAVLKKNYTNLEKKEFDIFIEKDSRTYHVGSRVHGKEGIEGYTPGVDAAAAAPLVKEIAQLSDPQKFGKWRSDEQQQSEDLSVKPQTEIEPQKEAEVSHDR